MIENNKQIIGRLEYISFPDFGIENIEAKIDTGAYNGSIHASSISEIEENGEPVLKFRVVDEEHPQYQNKDIFIKDFIQKKIISSNGESEIRYLIQTRFLLGKQEFVSWFSLSNRKSLRKPILLGRRNIKKHFLINAARKFVLGIN